MIFSNITLIHIILVIACFLLSSLFDKNELLNSIKFFILFAVMMFPIQKYSYVECALILLIAFLSKLIGLKILRKYLIKNLTLNLLLFFLF